MTKCSYCGTTILLGGVSDGDMRFCNQTCRQKGVVVRLAKQMPDDLVQEHILSVHAGNCPKCNGRGPVDVHTSYRVWSALVLTSWSSRPRVSCRSCGRKQQASDAFFCFLFGWWGFPWGLILTPVQVTRNVIGLFKTPDPTRPSATLGSVVRSDLAVKFLQAQRTNQAAPSTVPPPLPVQR